MGNQFTSLTTVIPRTGILRTLVILLVVSTTITTTDGTNWNCGSSHNSGTFTRQDDCTLTSWEIQLSADLSITGRDTLTTISAKPLTGAQTFTRHFNLAIRLQVGDPFLTLTLTKLRLIGGIGGSLKTESYKHSRGGSIYCNGPAIVRTFDSLFEGQSAYFGGTLYGYSGCHIFLTRTNIISSTSTNIGNGHGSGGAIYIQTNYEDRLDLGDTHAQMLADTTNSGNRRSKLDIDGGYFSNNIGSGSGVINAYNADVVIKDAVFESNTASGSGGVLMVKTEYYFFFWFQCFFNIIYFFN